MEYIIHIGVLCLIYAMLASSLDLLVGHAGILSVAHASFFGVGAYAAGLTATRAGGGFLLSLLAGVCCALAIGLLFALPALSARGDTAVLVTFSGQMILSGILLSATSLTGGPLGIDKIPVASVLGWKVDTPLDFLLVGFMGEVATLLSVLALTRGAHGRVIHAIREDDIVAIALGKSVIRFKVTIFVTSAVLAALAGVIYAYYVSFIDPSSFTVSESILILSMVILGGAARPIGPVLGAVALVSFPEVMRAVGLPSSVAANLRQVAYGALLILAMRFRPTGVLGRLHL